MKTLLVTFAIIALATATLDHTHLMRIDSHLTFLAQTGYSIDTVVELLNALKNTVQSNLDQLVANWEIARQSMRDNIANLRSLSEAQHTLCDQIDATIVALHDERAKYQRFIDDAREILRVNEETLAARLDARCAANLAFVNKLKNNQDAIALLLFLRDQMGAPGFADYLKANPAALVELETHIKEKKHHALGCIAKHHMLAMINQAYTGEDDLGYNTEARTEEEIGTGHIDNDQGALSVEHFTIDARNIEDFLAELLGFIDKLVEDLHCENEQLQVNEFNSVQSLIDYQTSVEQQATVLKEYIALWQSAVDDIDFAIHTNEVASGECHARVDELDASIECAVADLLEKSEIFKDKRDKLQNTINILQKVIDLYIAKVASASEEYKARFDREIAEKEQPQPTPEPVPEEEPAPILEEEEPAQPYEEEPAEEEWPIMEEEAPTQAYEEEPAEEEWPIPEEEAPTQAFEEEPTPEVHPIEEEPAPYYEEQHVEEEWPVVEEEAPAPYYEEQPAEEAWPVQEEEAPTVYEPVEEYTPAEMEPAQVYEEEPAEEEWPVQEEQAPEAVFEPEPEPEIVPEPYYEQEPEPEPFYEQEPEPYYESQPAETPVEPFVEQEPAYEEPTEWNPPVAEEEAPAPEPVYEEEPAPVYEEEPTQAYEEEPVYHEEETATPVYEEEPAPVYEEEPTQTYEEEPVVEEEPAPVAEEEPVAEPVEEEPVFEEEAVHEEEAEAEPVVEEEEAPAPVEEAAATETIVNEEEETFEYLPEAPAPQAEEEVIEEEPPAETFVDDDNVEAEEIQIEREGVPNEGEEDLGLSAIPEQNLEEQTQFIQFKYHRTNL